MFVCLSIAKDLVNQWMEFSLSVNLYKGPEISFRLFLNPLPCLDARRVAASSINKEIMAGISRI